MESHRLVEMWVVLCIIHAANLWQSSILGAIKDLYHICGIQQMY